jgi:hypothetical protein
MPSSVGGDGSEGPWDLLIFIFPLACSIIFHAKL